MRAGFRMGDATWGRFMLACPGCACTWAGFMLACPDCACTWAGFMLACMLAPFPIISARLHLGRISDGRCQPDTHASCVCSSRLPDHDSDGMQSYPSITSLNHIPQSRTSITSLNHVPARSLCLPDHDSDGSTRTTQAARGHTSQAAARPAPPQHRPYRGVVSRGALCVEPG